MKRDYKNTLDLSYTLNPNEQRNNFINKPLKNSDLLPKTLNYEDIDREFKKWVDEKIVIVQDGIKLPTMVLYSNQRFSEYSQTWQYTDENNNIRLNFKTVTRENNPSHGTILGDTFNIPGNRFYKFKSIEAIDDSGKKYVIEYKMKQPTPVDLIYKVSIMTNKYASINDFNAITNKIFNSRQEYIAPNGYYMSMTLENISDESEYNIQDRQFFSQTFAVKVKGFILQEDDFRIEEKPIATVVCWGDDGKREKPLIELSEYEPTFDENEGYYYKQLEIEIDFSFCYPFKGKTKFTIDEDFTLTNILFEEVNYINKNNIKLYINDDLITNNLLKDSFEGYVECENKPMDSNENNTLKCIEIPIKKNKNTKYITVNDKYYRWNCINFKDGDEIIIETQKLNRYNNCGTITLKGYNKLVAYPK